MISRREFVVQAEVMVVGVPFLGSLAFAMPLGLQVNAKYLRGLRVS